jgi:hypothetical protein
MKDFSLAVGTMPLILRRAFGTARWRPAIRLHQLRITRKKHVSAVNHSDTSSPGDEKLQ